MPPSSRSCKVDGDRDLTKKSPAEYVNEFNIARVGEGGFLKAILFYQPPCVFAAPKPKKRSARSAKDDMMDECICNLASASSLKGKIIKAPPHTAARRHAALTKHQGGSCFVSLAFMRHSPGLQNTPKLKQTSTRRAIITYTLRLLHITTSITSLA